MHSLLLSLWFGVLAEIYRVTIISWYIDWESTISNEIYAYQALYLRVFVNWDRQTLMGPFKIAFEFNKVMKDPSIPSYIQRPKPLYSIIE